MDEVSRRVNLHAISVFLHLKQIVACEVVRSGRCVSHHVTANDGRMQSFRGLSSHLNRPRFARALLAKEIRTLPHENDLFLCKSISFRKSVKSIQEKKIVMNLHLHSSHRLLLFNASTKLQSSAHTWGNRKD